MLWIHRIGYVTTPVVAIILLSLLVVTGVSLQHDLKSRQQSLDQPRALTFDEDYEELSRWLLAQLPALSVIRPDGIRMLVQPSLTGRSYAVMLTRPDDRADARGTLIATTAFADTSASTTNQQRVDFVIPAVEYAQTMAALDNETASFKGTPDRILDGVSVSFERVRGNTVLSGSGNDAYRNRLAALIYQLLRRHVAAPPLPDLADWQVSFARHCKERIAARASLHGYALPEAVWKALGSEPKR